MSVKDWLSWHWIYIAYVGTLFVTAAMWWGTYEYLTSGSFLTGALFAFFAAVLSIIDVVGFAALSIERA